MNLAPLERRISLWHQGRVKEVARNAVQSGTEFADGIRSMVDTLTVDGQKTAKRLKRQLRKNVKKSRFLQQAAFLLLIAPLVIPVGAVMASYSVTPAVAPIEPIATAPVQLSLSDSVVTVENPAVTIEVQESVYQAAERAKIAERLVAAQARAIAKPLTVTFTASSTELMTLAGIPQNQWAYVDFIINHEAGWNGTLTYNRQGSGAYGICQALPGRKMASAGADWQTNTLTQLKWCNGYALARYGSWENAYHFWLKNRWW